MRLLSLKFHCDCVQGKIHKIASLKDTYGPTPKMKTDRLINKSLAVFLATTRVDIATSKPWHIS